MKKVYTFFTDPGHGWVKVLKQELIDLGIADKISSYSYQKGEYAYLEEDCDASLFFETLKNKNIEVELKESNSATRMSRIRNYDDYKL